MQSNGFIYSDELNDALTFLVESGDVKVTRKLDNIEIDTGHSCKVTAKTTSMEFVATATQGRFTQFSRRTIPAKPHHEKDNKPFDNIMIFGGYSPSRELSKSASKLRRILSSRGSIVKRSIRHSPLSNEILHRI